MRPTASVRRSLQIHAALDAVRPMHGTVEQRRNLMGRNTGCKDLFRLGYLAWRSLVVSHRAPLSAPGSLSPDTDESYAQGNFEWK